MRIIARLNVGGPAIHVALLTAGLNDDVFQSSLVAGSIGAGEGDMSYYAASKGIEPLSVASLGRDVAMLSDLGSLLSLYRLMRQQRPHVVHTHTAKAGFVGRLAAWLAGVPVVVHTFHGHAFHSYFGSLATHIILMMEKLAARMSDTIITLSPALKNELMSLGIATSEKIRVVSLGLELQRFATAENEHGRFRRELDLPEDVPLVGIVGRLVPVKNHALFIRCAALVKETLPEAHFVVVGDGELRGELETMSAEYGLAEAMVFTGWLKDLPVIFADLNALAITSHNEGTPVSVLESMAAGVAVVATAVGGVSDVLGEGRYGKLVPPGDVNALAAALIEVLGGTDQGRLEEARSHALSNYDSNRMVADMRGLYLELLQKKGIQIPEQRGEVSLP